VRLLNVYLTANTNRSPIDAAVRLSERIACITSDIAVNPRERIRFALRILKNFAQREHAFTEIDEDSRTISAID